MTSTKIEWVACSRDKESVVCICGNTELTDGFYPVGLNYIVRENPTNFHDQTPIGEVNHYLWGLIECAVCDRVIDTDTIMQDNGTVNLAPPPGRAIDRTFYTDRMLVLYTPPTLGV